MLGEIVAVKHSVVVLDLVVVAVVVIDVVVVVVVVVAFMQVSE